MSSATNKSMYLKVGSTIIIPLLILLIPCTETFTYSMKVFIALTVCFLMWAAMELTNLLIPSLLWPVMLIVLNIVPAANIYSSWLQLVIPCCVAAILLGNILSETGLLKRIAFWTIWKCGGSFNRTMLALYLATLAISFLTFGGASTIVAALCAGMVFSLGMQNKEEGAIVMMVGMLGAVTSRLFIYKPLTIGLIRGSLETTGVEMPLTYTQMLFHNWPIILYSIILIIIFFYVGKTRKSEFNNSKEYFENEYKTLGKMTATEKKGLGVILFLLLGVLTESFHHIDGMAIFVIAAALCYIPGINIGSEKAIKALPIGTIFFIASCMAIGAGCTYTGLTALLSKTLLPYVTGLGTVGTLFVVLILGIFLNLAMTPMAMVSAFTGPLVALTLPLGISSHAVAYSFLFAGDLVFLPYEFVNFLIFFSFGCMTMKQFVKYNVIKMATFIVFFLIALVPYWGLIGLL